MGVMFGAQPYFGTPWRLPKPLRPNDYVERERPVTTDPEEGRRQIEAMQPEPIKAGDKVRLSAGGKPMTVLRFEDYGNDAVCSLDHVVLDHETGITAVDTFPVRSLVRVD